MKPKKDKAPADFNVKAFMQTAAYEKERREVQAEINEGKVSIDRSVFKKTAEEKVLAKNFKSHYKRHGNTHMLID